MNTSSQPEPAEFLAFRLVPTPLGTVLFAATAVGIVRVGLPNENLDQVAEELAMQLHVPVVDTAEVLDQAAAELAEYFAGDRLRFDVPLDWRLSDGFDLHVQQQLPYIAFGSTNSYKEVAEDIGNPNAMRAVGASCGDNPLPLLVPCHRVIRANGDVGGYRGGVAMKVALLEFEKQVLSAEKKDD